MEGTLSPQQKHGGNILFFFESIKRTGRLVRVNGITNKADYCEMLNAKLKVPAINLKLQCDWRIIHDSDRKQITRLNIFRIKM